MFLNASKRLQTTQLYKEHKHLIQKCYKTSLNKEHAQQDFYKRMLLIKQSGEIFKMNHSFENEHKRYIKSIEQKIYTIEHLARKQGFEPIFMTLTLPKEYHPFSSIEYKGKRLYTNANKEFFYSSIEEGILEGYAHLKEIYRTLYKRIKNHIKDLYFIRVVELHKSLIPHMHILFFVPKSKNKIILKDFAKIKVEFRLEQVDCSLVQQESHNKRSSTVKTNINRASKYIMKYIVKNSEENIFMLRVLDGFKRINKIRMITTSNLNLSLEDFRRLYHNLDKETKTSLLKEAKAKGVNLFTLTLENMAKVTTQTNVAGTYRRIKKYSKLLQKRFVILKQVTRRQLNGGAFSYKVKSFLFFIDRKLIYKKESIRREILNTEVYYNE